MEDSDPSEVGVQMALDRICALEAKIRQAIQNTHPLSSSFDRDAQAADREREALLAVRETLELLEDKLREFRDSKSDEDRQTMALSQLDSLRRELIVAARDSLALVIFAKDVVREVLAFAEMAAGEPAPTGRDMPLSPIQQVNNNGLYSPHSRSPSFTKPSPKPRKDLFLRTSVGENMLGPAPLPAPSMSPKQTQTRRGLWQPGSPNAHDSPGRPRHVRGTVEEADRIIYAASRNPDAGSRRQSPSHQLHPARVRVDEQELYSTTNGSSRYHYDPEYGGKVNLTNFRHKQEGAAEQPEPDVRIPALEHGARVLDVFSDDRSTRSARTAYDPRLDDDVSSVSTRAYSHHHRQYHSPAPSGTRRLGMDGLPRGGRLPAPEPVTVPLPKRSGRGFWGTVGVCVQILVAGAIMAAAASGVALLKAPPAGVLFPALPPPDVFQGRG
ncbi:hypothetical protein WJX72_007476 [[Myrmecia] bisecta]|uniref:Uncharacterized protein n=1 Tax=[Myrmecia] bisecta TaxID=41462 RepID=A0AAW1QFN3_9CHLO